MNFADVNIFTQILQLFSKKEFLKIFLKGAIMSMNGDYIGSENTVKFDIIRKGLLI